MTKKKKKKIFFLKKFHPTSPLPYWLIHGAVALIVPHKAYGPPVLAAQTEGLLSLKASQCGLNMCMLEKLGPVIAALLECSTETQYSNGYKLMRRRKRRRGRCRELNKQTNKKTQGLASKLCTGM